MASKTPSLPAKQNTLLRHKYAVIIAVILILLAFDLSPFGGNIRFYSKWVECGQKPVATRGSGYMNAGAIHYIEPSPLPGFHPTLGYFCTPLEAERAGYSANPDTYSFPHLQKE